MKWVLSHFKGSCLVSLVSLGYVPGVRRLSTRAVGNGTVPLFSVRFKWHVWSAEVRFFCVLVPDSGKTAMMRNVGPWEVRFGGARSCAHCRGTWLRCSF